MMRYLPRALFLLLATGSCWAQLKLPHLFTDGVVLQREKVAPVWGWGKPASEVKVTFEGKELTTTVGADGKWRVQFEGLKAQTEGSSLVVHSGEQSLEIKDVLVGEVWLASGQSNMEWPLKRSGEGKKEIESARDPLLRVFVSANVARQQPQGNWWGSWKRTEPSQSGAFTAVGYYFGKRLRAELGVPVGIIECAWGGKPVESFTSEEALKALPEAKGVLERKATAISAWDPAKAHKEFEKKRKEFEIRMVEWKKTKKGKRPHGPRKPIDPRQHPSLHSTIYHGMIAPLVGYGARGVIWYQGESNANEATAQHYEELLRTMVQDWRARWGRDLSFYWVQLANFREPVTQPGTHSDWVVVQDEMRQALKTIPHGGMAVINDIGDVRDIHPGNKRDVGQRLARWALARDYGKKDIEVSGPLFASVSQKEGQLIVQFTHASGLKTRDGKAPAHFEIAGPDGKWHWAQTKIAGETVVLWHDEVSEPQKVRYAWASNPTTANLVNAAGLPASCFLSQ